MPTVKRKSRLPAEPTSRDSKPLIAYGPPLFGPPDHADGMHVATAEPKQEADR
jgi:hypothetical protein